MPADKPAATVHGTGSGEQKDYGKHKFVVSDNGSKCEVCSVAHNGDASTWVPDVPAQPAGAREQASCTACEGTGVEYDSPGRTRPCSECNGKRSIYAQLEHWRFSKAFVELAQQTAAKDAEIERLTAMAGDLTDRNDALTDESCKLQDDVASIVSSHRSDWSWDDVLSDVRALKQSSLTAEQRLTVIDALNDAIMLNEGAIEGATMSQGQPPFTPEENRRPR